MWRDTLSSLLKCYLSRWMTHYRARQLKMQMSIDIIQHDETWYRPKNRLFRYFLRCNNQFTHVVCTRDEFSMCAGMSTTALTMSLRNQRHIDVSTCRKIYLSCFLLCSNAKDDLCEKYGHVNETFDASTCRRDLCVLFPLACLNENLQKMRTSQWNIC